MTDGVAECSSTSPSASCWSCRSCSRWRWCASCWCTSRPAIRWSRCCRPTPRQALAEQMRKAYGFDRPLPVQFGIWLWNAVQRRSRHLDRDRPLGRRGGHARAVGNTVMLAVFASLIGFVFGADVRLPRRLFPRHLGRQARHHDLDHRRVDAALLARHGAGDHLLGAARLAAGGRRRARAAGRGTGSTSST